MFSFRTNPYAYLGSWSDGTMQHDESWQYPRTSPITMESQPSARTPLGEDMSTSFIDNTPIHIAVASTERQHGTRKIWYKILVKHGFFNWTVNKKMSEILQLDWALRVFRLKKCFEVKTDQSNQIEKKRPDGIGLNLWFLSSSKEERITEYLMNAIKDYLNYVLSIESYRYHPSVLNFFEISGFSFRPELGEKGREGLLEKRCSSCCVKNSLWDKKWFIFKESFLLYLDCEKKHVEGIFLLDRWTVVLQNEERLVLKNSSRTLFIKFPTIYQATSWKTSINEKIEITERHFIKNPTEGFAPMRQALAQWFVDGCDYFLAVADAMEAARHEIFISAWFLAPHVFLKRWPEMEEKWMLKSILKRKADQGVKIYVLLYDAPDGFIKLGDQFAKDTLEQLNKENIRVLRHRGKILGKTILWSHHEKLVIVDQNMAFVSGMDLTFGRWDFHEHPLTDMGISEVEHVLTKKEKKKGKTRLANGQMWPGVDYTNDYVTAKINYKKPFKDHIDRDNVPRTPWHDIACATYGESSKDVARHFIQMWNFVKAKDHRNEDDIPYLLPKAANLLDNNPSLIQPGAVNTWVQVLRSASKWAIGIKETERSIAGAYEKVIDEAEHYVYIENQFFISQTSQEIVQNGVTLALSRRIIRAFREGVKFRVYIVLPLVPMFEGDFSKANKSQQIQIFAHYQYYSISRGESSLIGSLRSYLTDEQINEYVCFCSLRTHGEINGKLATEVLYVHSKLLIVDDRIAIIGSPNINDRSMLGSRDSEVALYIQDIEMVEGIMNNRPYRFGKFVSSLRCRVFAEHLGLLHLPYESQQPLSDIVGDEFYHGIWKWTAENNTNIYKKVFRSVPADDVRRFSQVKRHQREKRDDKEELCKVKGHLVEFPMQYLEDENLKRDRCGLLPIEIFT